MAEKMNAKEQAEIRAKLYDMVLAPIVQNGMSTEIISDGALIHLGNEQYATIKVTIKDASKFNIEAEREKYRQKVARQEEKAAKAREKKEKQELED